MSLWSQSSCRGAPATALSPFLALPVRLGRKHQSEIFTPPHPEISGKSSPGCWKWFPSVAQAAAAFPEPWAVGYHFLLPSPPHHVQIWPPCPFCQSLPTLPALLKDCVPCILWVTIGFVSAPSLTSQAPRRAPLILEEGTINPHLLLAEEELPKSIGFPQKVGASISLNKMLCKNRNQTQAGHKLGAVSKSAFCNCRAKIQITFSSSH